MGKINIVCEKCGGTNIQHDAYANWDIDKQEFVLSAMARHNYCNDCEKEIDCKEIPINVKEIPIIGKNCPKSEQENTGESDPVLNEYLEAVIAMAQNAFWQTIADAFPLLESGDIDPGNAFKFDEMSKKLVEDYIENNVFRD